MNSSTQLKSSFLITKLMKRLTHICQNRIQFTILLLGFTSGLPAALTASTLQAWFTDAGLNLKTIGAVTLLVMPYTLRFIWAPLFDFYKIPGFALRQGWLLVTQIGLTISIGLMAFATPDQTFSVGSWHIPYLLLWGFLTAVLSASQDVVINAYQVDISPPNQQGLSAAVYVTGWRVGAIISGALALILASKMGWHWTYLFMASLMSIGIAATLLSPKALTLTKSSYSFVSALFHPLIDFFNRYQLKGALIFILLILTYKLGDALALALNTTFLLRTIGFDLATIGLINKTVSLFAALFGGLVAGFLMTRISLYRALIIFGLLQGIANLGYALMAYWGKSFFLLVFTAFMENFFSGMGTIALVALIMALCNKEFSATQFALLNALAFAARVIVGPLAAILVDEMGWFMFFVGCFVISLPTLGFVFANKNIVRQLGDECK